MLIKCNIRKVLALLSISWKFVATLFNIDGYMAAGNDAHNLKVLWFYCCHDNSPPIKLQGVIFTSDSTISLSINDNNKYIIYIHV